MRQKTSIIILLVLLTCVTAFGQTSYKGLTPGKSTKINVQRVLGLPVNKVNETLIEYRPQPLTSKIYVQYDPDSVVEKIEARCRLANSTCNDFVRSLNLRVPKDPETIKLQTGDDENFVLYFGAPLYLVTTKDEKSEVIEDQWVFSRIAFYSRELYAAAVTKALIESGISSVESSDPGYEEVTGVVRVRAADGSLRPAAGAGINFCWAVPSDVICSRFGSATANSQGIFSLLVLRGTHLVVVTGPGLKWTYKEGVKIPLTSPLELVGDPGTGAMPTTRDVQIARKKN